MENTVQQQPRLFAVQFGYFKERNPGIALTIAPASFVGTADDPVPGVMLEPAQARELAYVLLLHAEQLASGLVIVPGNERR
jgi:hypothetical protein